MDFNPDLGTDICPKNVDSSDQGSRSGLDQSPSQCNGNTFCTVQRSYRVWSPNLSPYPSLCPAM